MLAFSPGFLLAIFFTFLKLSPFCCWPISTTTTTKRLLAGWVFADLWSGFRSVLLINALPFWVTALIDQPIADSARSAGCFEAMEERIQLS